MTKKLEVTSSGASSSRDRQEKEDHQIELDFKLQSQTAPSVASVFLARVVGYILFGIGFAVAAILPGKAREVLDLFGVAIPALISHHLIFAFLKGIIGAGILIGGTLFILRARKLALIRDADEIRELPESFVLYLRSFGADDRMATPVVSGKYYFPVTSEEQLASAVKDVGPLVAIGRPGEKLPEIGALRLYVEDADWQKTIHNLMSRARLVLFLAGDSDGFWWELQHAIQELDPSNIAVLIPFDKKAYAAFTSEASRRISLDLPQTKRLSRLEGDVRAILHFDESGKAHLYSARELRGRDAFRLGHFSMTKGAASYLRVLLRPVYEQLGVNWRPMRPNWGTLSLMIFGVAALGVGVVVWITEWTSEPTPYEIAKKEINQVLHTDAGVWKQLHGLSRNEQAAHVTSLVKSGLWRLEAPMLVQRATLFAKLLNATDTEVCARLVIGSASEAEVLTALQALSEQEQAIYWDIVVRALKSALSRENGRELDDNSIGTALDAIFEGMAETDARQLSDAISAMQDADPMDLCWAGRTLYRRLNEIPEPYKSTLAQALVEP